MNGVRRIRAAACGLGVALAFAAARVDAQSEPVRVEVVGVTGDAERNVRLVLEIARAADQGKLPPSRIRELHQRADADIELALDPWAFTGQPL